MKTLVNGIEQAWNENTWEEWQTVQDKVQGKIIVQADRVTRERVQPRGKVGAVQTHSFTYLQDTNDQGVIILGQIDI